MTSKKDDKECTSTSTNVKCPESCRCSYSQYYKDSEHEEVPEPSPPPPPRTCPKVLKCQISPKTRSKLCKCPVIPQPAKIPECPKFLKGCCPEPNYYYGDKYCPHVLVQYWEDERLRFVNDQVTKKTTYKRDFIPHVLTPRDILLITRLRMKNQGLGSSLINGEPPPSDCASMSTYQTSYNHYKRCSRLAQRPLHDFVRGLYCSPGSDVRDCLGFGKEINPFHTAKCDFSPCEPSDYKYRHKREAKDLSCENYYFIPKARKDPPTCCLPYCPTVVPSPHCHAKKPLVQAPFYVQK